MKFNQWKSIAITAVLMMMVLGCGINFEGLGGESDAEQTLQAIYIQQTLEALEEPAAPQEEVITAPTSTVDVTHTTIPGEPGWVSQWWRDVNSSSTSSQKRASGGDFFDQNLLERPFTAQDMLYRPDVDLDLVEISQDAAFYYFILHLEGVDPATGMLSATYGVELDLNRDGRGEYLLWAKGDGNSQWNIAEVSVHHDSNGDVGGSRPLRSDAPNYTGDSYDQVLFSPEHLADPDMAWKRVDPADSSVMQLALKKSVINNASTFMWNAWADDGVKTPSQFDYNDFFTAQEAGSPINGAADYPLKALYLVDNTCRLDFGFEASGNEPGLCPKPIPTATPEPTQRPPTPRPPTPRPPCDCASFPNFTFINDAECCVYCGYEWTGNVEFPCDIPAN